MQNHQRSRTHDGTDTAPTTTVTHRYNLLGQRIATDVAADGKPAEPLARYHYNADGSLAETTLGPDGLPRKYRYDPLGELTQIADSAMTETLGYKLPGGEGYGDGNIKQAAYDLHYADGVSHTYIYSYDPHDRLTAAQNDQPQLSGSSLEAVTCDPNGNIQTERRGDGQTRTYALAPKTNQVASVTGDSVNTHYAYDAKGRMAGASGDGAPDVASLDYDPLTNLPQHVSADDALEMDCHYDVHNRRVAKVGHHGDGATTARIYYRGQGAAALTELAGDAAALEPQTYLRGPGGLQAVTLQGQRYFVSRDHLGSTRALMDTAGKVAAYFNYTPFGTLMPGNSQDSDGLAAYMAYRFAGTEYDAETGLYNNRARWYDPALGRFLTPDPAHQYPSPYVYVGNNPVNGVDPTGMMNEGEGWDDGLAPGDKGKRNAPQDDGAVGDDDDDYESLEEASEEDIREAPDGVNSNAWRKTMYGADQEHPDAEAGIDSLAGDERHIETYIPNDISNSYLFIKQPSGKDIHYYKALFIKYPHANELLKSFMTRFPNATRQEIVVATRIVLVISYVSDGLEFDFKFEDYGRSTARFRSAVPNLYAHLAAKFGHEFAEKAMESRFWRWALGQYQAAARRTGRLLQNVGDDFFDL